VAEIQLMSHLIVLLPILARKIVAIPKVIVATDSKGAKIVEELAAVHIE
jgi:hypothetical protein